MPFYSNAEIKSAPPQYEPASINVDGSVAGPKCCGQKMTDNGGCSSGCCDDYKCDKCGHEVRIEWPD